MDCDWRLGLGIIIAWFTSLRGYDDGFYIGCFLPMVKSINNLIW